MVTIETDPDDCFFALGICDHNTMMGIEYTAPLTEGVSDIQKYRKCPGNLIELLRFEFLGVVDDFLGQQKRMGVVVNDLDGFRLANRTVDNPFLLEQRISWLDAEKQENPHDPQKTIEKAAAENPFRFGGFRRQISLYRRIGFIHDVGS